MKSLSVLATSLALATGGAAAVTLPTAVAAQKKGKEDGTLKLSPAVLKPVQAAQPLLAAQNAAAAEPLIAQAEAAAKTDVDKYVVATLRYNLEVTRLQAARTANPAAPVNETSLAAPLDALIASPRTPQADKARFAFRRGALAFNGKSYPQAIQYFGQAKQLGYVDPNLDLLLAKAKYESGDLAGGSADLQSAIAQAQSGGQKAPEDYYRYAIAQANKKKDGAQTIDWLSRYVAAYPTAKNWRDVIVTYGLQQNSVATLDDAQQIDLFRLMRTTGALADQNDYKTYALKVNKRGLPHEAEAVLKEGIAAGKLQATDTDVKQIRATAATRIKTEGSLAPLAVKAAAAADGKLAASTGDAYLGSGEYAKAAELYRTALQKGGVDAAEVNTHLGIALAKVGDKAAAKTAFDAVATAPRKGIADLWKVSLGTGAAPSSTPA